MNIDPWIFSFSALTVIATIWMGFWSARKSKTTSDFFVAGRSVSVGWNASAISGEYLSAASFMGVAGMVMSSGYDALWYPVCYACGYLFLLLFIAGPLRRFGAYTIPDFAEGRFDSPVFRKIAVVFVLFIGFFYTMPQMKGAGTTLAYIFPGLPYWAGVVLVGAVITLNVALGGMKGITLVQAFQYWAKMFAISLPIFVLMSVYGHYGKQVGVNADSPDAIPPLEAIHVGSMPDSSGRLPDQHLYVNIGGMSRGFPFWKNLWMDLRGKERRMRVSHPAGIYSLPDLLDMYCQSHVWHRRLDHASGFIALEIANRQIAYSQVRPLDRYEFDEHLRGVLKTNGITLIQITPNLFKAFPTTNAAKYGVEFRQATTSKRAAFHRPLSADGNFDQAAVHSPVQMSSAPKPISELDKSIAELGTPLEVPSMSLGGSSDRHYDWAALIKLSVSDFLRLAVFPSSSPTSALSARLPPANTTIFVDVGGQNVRIPDSVSRTLLERKSERLLARYRKSDALRKPLPDKAPKDETWLNPFGPLTTKAAKAANLSAEQTKPYALLYTYSLIIALVCGTAGLPHILVRFYTNPDGVAAKRTTMWVMILIGVFYLFPPVFGVMGRNLLPELYAASGAKGTDKVVLELPRILNSMGNAKSSMLNAQQTTNSLSIENRASAIEHRKGIPWGSILSGITCAGAFAAFMSTFSGLLVSMTGALAHDVYGRILRPRSTPQQRLRAFKISAIVIGAVAILLGMQVEQLQINFMVGQAFAIAAASYFPLLFMSCWWRGMTVKGAATGMLAGGSCALIAVTLTNFSDLKWIDLASFWATHPLARILSEQPAIWTVPLAIGLMIIVSKLTRNQVPVDIRMKMLVLHAPEQLGLKQEYIQEHQAH